MKSKNIRESERGQASIELAVAIVLMLIIVSGMLHINRLARTSLFLHSVLRGEAGCDAMNAGALGDAADYISDWKAGPDGMRHTADDRPIRDSGNLSATLLALINHSASAPVDWQYISDRTQLPTSMVRLHDQPILSTAIEMKHRKERLYVPVEAVIRELVYDKDEVPIEEEVWIPLMGGLY